ncbi:MAG: flagellar protein FlgN [Oscillospiraceae bacterium]|nr:flagellar protein FlgN [Oscillospiraceae bacterium]
MVAVLELFDKITDILTQLAELERDKAAAVRKDDLTALDKSLKQEQVLALSIRGLEQKRTDLLSQFGLLELPLSDLPGKFPADQRMEAKKTVDRLRDAYQIYRHAAEVARDTLECNLHEIEKILANAGVDPKNGPGYGSPDIEPPATMKTDFHA